ncbi:MAG: OmpH family outer membrane protein [Bacteroidales bacterium]|nr:OmpH family outer membrane protein [Bacteroidales bacterium]
MKKLLFGLIFVLFSTTLVAQRYAFVDSDYILNNIPAYKAAQDKLNKLSLDWQKEIEAGYAEVEKMIRDFNTEKILLTEEMIKQGEAEISGRENAVKELQHRFFGPEGELFIKRQELIKPIQDEIYNVIKDIAEKGNYAIIFDTAIGATILFTDPKFDKSDEVLEKLGYKN